VKAPDKLQTLLPGLLCASCGTWPQACDALAVLLPAILDAQDLKSQMDIVIPTIRDLGEHNVHERGRDRTVHEGQKCAGEANLHRKSRIGSMHVHQAHSQAVEAGSCRAHH